MNDDALDEFLAEQYAAWIETERETFDTELADRWAEFAKSDLIQEMWNESETQEWQEWEERVRNEDWPEERERLTEEWRKNQEGSHE